MDSALSVIKQVARMLEARGYGGQPRQAGAEVLAVKQGRGLGPFFPYTDYVFLHDMDGETDAAALAKRHAAGRAYAESQFTLPRVLRYRIPCVVTVGVTTTPPAPETTAFVADLRGRQHWEGGIKESVFLLDLSAGLMLSAGLESTPTRYGGSIRTTVNPNNRVHELIAEITAGLDPALGEGRDA
ncbi:MAG: hypothetical protein Q7W30_07170 [Coriobacteriia bacterium]|nr:hypothetical protein [Coriobacteriia bacterium]